MLLSELGVVVPIQVGNGFSPNSTEQFAHMLRNRFVPVVLLDTGGSGFQYRITSTAEHHLTNDCQRQSVEYAAAVAFDPEWTDTTASDGRPAALGTLRLRRRHGSDPVTVTQINGSVLLSIAPVTPAAAGALLLTLAGNAADATLPVILTESGRCEAHALAESKHTFFLPVALAVAASPVVLIDVIPDDAAKIQLLKMINRSCGVS